MCQQSTVMHVLETGTFSNRCSLDPGAHAESMLFARLTFGPTPLDFVGMSGPDAQCYHVCEDPA